jgi:hypothetical protein
MGIKKKHPKVPSHRVLSLLRSSFIPTRVAPDGSFRSTPQLASAVFTRKLYAQCERKSYILVPLSHPVISRAPTEGNCNYRGVEPHEYVRL